MEMEKGSEGEGCVVKRIVHRFTPHEEICFLYSFRLFFTSLSPWNGNLPAENMAIGNILWELVLVGMTMAYGLSPCRVRAIAWNMDRGSL